jgi:hypothetical protein
MPPGFGIDSDDPAKDACEMSLIAHSAFEGDPQKGAPRAQHHFLGAQDAPLHDVRKRGLSKAVPKGTEEMARAELDNAGEVGGADIRAKVVLDVRPDAFSLPRRETSSQA